MARKTFDVATVQIIIFAQIGKLKSNDHKCFFPTKMSSRHNIPSYSFPNSIVYLLKHCPKNPRSNWKHFKQHCILMHMPCLLNKPMKMKYVGYSGRRSCSIRITGTKVVPREGMNFCL